MMVVQMKFTIIMSILRSPGQINNNYIPSFFLTPNRNGEKTKKIKFSNFVMKLLEFLRKFINFRQKSINIL